MKECQSIAHGLMVTNRAVKPANLILKGLFSRGSDHAGFISVLVPSAYLSYINGPGSVKIFVHKWQW